jgi:hypothetical protein
MPLDHIKAPTLHDHDFGAQDGDPGATPPPLNMEQAEEELLSPIGALAAQTMQTALKSSRHQSAVLELLGGFNHTAIYTQDAMRMLSSEDIAPMAPVCRVLARTLTALVTEIEGKLPKLQS